MATHAAYGGDPHVRELFLEFCKRDPNFSSDKKAEGRWESLSLKKKRLLGVGTLSKICRDHDVPDATMRAVFMGNPADDFEEFDDPDFYLGTNSGIADADGVPSELQYTAGSESALGALNEKYTAVFANGLYRIMYREGEGETANGLPWVAASKTDFINRHDNLQYREREPRSG